MKKAYLQIFAWSLSALVVLLAVDVALGSKFLHWSFRSHLSAYSFVPQC